MVIANYARSWILLVPLIPSIAVSIFDLYHFLSNRTLRKALNNHAIILLLLCGLIDEITDVVWQIHFTRTGVPVSTATPFCFTWVFMSAITYISVFVLMAWASIERHILIFYPILFSTKMKRFCFHYLPLAMCILYPVMFYFTVFFILPCNVTFMYNRKLCNLYQCITGNPIMALWDSIAHFIMPGFITVIFSIALLIRVLYNRYRVRQRIEWRNYRKMAVQLLPISALYVLLQFPPISLYAAYSIGLSRNVAADYYSDTLFFTYWVILLTPFASALSLPDLRSKCRNLFFFWRRERAVGPAILTRTRSNGGRAGLVTARIQ